MLQKLGRGLATGDTITTSSNSGDGGSPYLDGVLASTCCDLDATIADSYTSGQTWANLTAAPADGSLQTDYDFLLGATSSPSTDDPTFTGTAGDPAAYFALDGGDLNVIKGTNPDALDSIQQTSGVGAGPTWLALAFKFGALSSPQVLFDNGKRQDADTYEILVFNGTKMRVNIKRSGTTLVNNIIVPQMNTTTDYLLIVSNDPTGTDNIRLWLNATTAIVDTDANPGTTTGNATTFEASLWARADGILPMSNGTRAYHFSFGTEFLDDTKAGQIITHLNARHGRTYA